MQDKLTARYRGRRFFRMKPQWIWCAVAVAAAVLTWWLPRILPAAAVSRYLLPLSRVVSYPVKLLTGWFPVSILELFLIAAVPAMAILLISLLRSPKRDGDEQPVLAPSITLAAALITVFNITMGFAYARLPLAEELGYGSAEVNAESLRSAVVTLAEEGADARAGADLEGVTVRAWGKRLREQYRLLSDRYPAYRGKAALPKTALLSLPMSYLGVGGMYSPFTCEAIVSSDTTAPALAFTVAHEMAHSLCFSRENEANFSAFLVCLSSDDASIRYSGCFMGLMYTLSAYRRAGGEDYAALYNSIDAGIRADFDDYFNHVSQYDGVINDIHSIINDAFLKSNGQTEGVASYGMMVDLIVAWNESR